MFRSLDALIGFATVMLVLSLVVTMLTQFAAEVLKLRSRHLRDGLIDLFGQLGWQFAGEGAQILAREIAGSKDAITREDLIESLLTLAQNVSSYPVYTELRDKIVALAPGSDPQTLLANLRRAALEHSIERPDLAAAAVRSTAAAGTPVAAIASEVFSVFDSTMDQVSARFTAQSRNLVALFGIVVALALPLDAFDLLQRFARSDAARNQAVALAQAVADGQTAASLAVARLEAAEVIVVPSSCAEWLARWRSVNYAGVAVGALLLTLGAPFWFHVLKDLVRLRSAVAGQESQDRAQRRSALVSAAPPGAAGGEQGDLQAG